jgi:hypothetical protein
LSKISEQFSRSHTEFGRSVRSWVGVSADIDVSVAFDFIYVDLCPSVAKGFGFSDKHCVPRKQIHKSPAEIAARKPAP